MIHNELGRIFAMKVSERKRAARGFIDRWSGRGNEK